MLIFSFLFIFILCPFRSSQSSPIHIGFYRRSRSKLVIFPLLFVYLFYYLFKSKLHSVVLFSNLLPPPPPAFLCRAYPTSPIISYFNVDFNPIIQCSSIWLSVYRKIKKYTFSIKPCYQLIKFDCVRSI
jgi:hypothetical protein